MLIRSATLPDAHAIAKAHITSRRETYPGIIPQSHLDDLNLEKRAALWEQAIKEGKFIVVAENKGQIIGFANGGKFRGSSDDMKGELYAIYLLAAYHRNGIGKKLFESVQRYLRQNDLTPFGIWVLEKNPACRFYEKMGGDVRQERWEEIGGVSLRELLFVYQ